MNRKNERSRSYAKVLMEGRLPAYIRDISKEGFRVYSPVPLPFEEGGRVECTVIPEEGEAFAVSGEIRWNRQEEEGDDILGVRILSYASDKGKSGFASLLRQFEGVS